MKNLCRAVLMLTFCFFCSSVFGVHVYIDNVPDWDAPVIAGPPPASPGVWDAWCVPTASANIMGYYRDKHGINSIADGSVFAATAAWPAVDFQDDTADAVSAPPRQDIGWFMNTNNLGETAAGGLYIGTMFSDIKPGLDGSGAGGHTGYFPAAGLNNVVVTNAAIAGSGQNTAAGGPYTVFTVWDRLTDNIDAGRPMLGSFSHWSLINKVSVDNGPVGLVDYDYYQWGAKQNTGPGGESWTNPDIGHTVTIVGYWENDTTSPYYDADNGWAPRAIIVHNDSDGYLNNPNRPLPVVVPFDVGPAWVAAPWVMNTEIVIPEPATVTLALLGCGALAALRRRRRQGT